MPDELGYWHKRFSRRRMLRYAGVAGLGVAVTSFIACGEDEETPAPTATATAAATTAPGTATPVATATTAAPAQSGYDSRLPGQRGGTPNLPYGSSSLGFLDPVGNTWESANLYASVYGQLFKWKRPPLEDLGLLEPEPYMAQSLEVPDGTTAIIKIYPGIKYHNKPPVNGRDTTAEDIKAFWIHMKDENVPGATRYTQQVPVHVPEVVDNLTAKFTFDHPYPPFFNYIADQWTSILAKEAIEKGPDFLNDATGIGVIGQGPYEMVKIDPAVAIDVKAFSIPWFARPDGAPEGPPPYYDGIHFIQLSDFSVQGTELVLAGQMDFAWANQAMVALPEWDTFEKDDRFFKVKLTLQDFNYMRINTVKPPMDDVRVRQALSLGIDRDGIVKSAFEGKGAVAHGPIPSARTPWGQPVEDVPYHTYDPTQAKQLLAAAGFADGLQVKNMFDANTGGQTKYALAGVEQLKAIGVEAEQVQQGDYSAYLQACREAKEKGPDALWHINMHWGNRYNDIDGYVREYHTQGGRNYGHWGGNNPNGPNLDDLIDKQAQELDLNARIAIVHEINQTIADQAWSPGIVQFIGLGGWNKKFQLMGDAAEWHTWLRSFIDGWQANV